MLELFIKNDDRDLITFTEYVLTDNSSSFGRLSETISNSGTNTYTFRVNISKKYSAVNSYSGLSISPESTFTYVIFDSYNGTFNVSGSQNFNTTVIDNGLYWTVTLTYSLSSSSFFVRLWGAISSDGLTIDSAAQGSEGFSNVYLSVSNGGNLVNEDLTQWTGLDGGFISQSQTITNEYAKLDLYKDETIQLTDTIQDVRDISSLFTSFTQDFNIPASATNNRTFGHWYENQVINNFDARFKVDAIIKINGADYKKGKISLIGASLKDNQINSYNVVFYGNTVTLKDLLGDDELKDLATNLDGTENSTFSGYDFLYSSEYARDGFKDGYFNGDLIFPFISGKNYYFYDSADGLNPAEGSSESRNILPSGNRTPRGVNYLDLKPALKVSKVLEAIEERYQLTFSEDFFTDSNAVWEELYLWLHRERGNWFEQIPFSGLNEQVNGQNGSYSGGIQGWFRTTNHGLPSVNPVLDEEYKVKWYSGGYLLFNITVKTSAPVLSWDKLIIRDSQGSVLNYSFDDWITYHNETPNSYTYQSIGGTDVYTYFFSGQNDPDLNPTHNNYTNNSGSDLEFNINFEVEAKFTSVDVSYATNPSILVDEVGVEVVSEYPSVGSYAESVFRNLLVDDLDFNITTQFPKMKVIDFLTGMFKLFNLTAYFDGEEVVVKTLDDYYQAGQTYDLTKWVDVSKTDVERSNLYSEINMEFEKYSTFAVLNANERTGDDFGNEYLDNTNQILSADFSFAFDGGKYDIKAPFEKMMFERMNDQDNENIMTNHQWGWMVSKDANPVLGKPLLFYAENIIANILFDKGGTYETLENYFRPHNILADKSQSLHYGSEFDEFTSLENTNSLFQNYWKNTIEFIYDRQTRVIKLTAYLPMHILVNVKLNDVLVIHNKKYRINSIKVNLMTGKADLELITDLGYYD